MQLFVGLFLVVALVSASGDIDLDSQILRGQEAKDGQFPYHVGVYVSIIGFYLFNCGGSLISETSILTAAHCIDGLSAKRIKTILGSKYVDRGIKRHVRNKVVHPEWNPEHYYRGNDIALLEIDPISYSDTIKAINLPPLSGLNATYEGHVAVTSGWGNIDDSIISPQILQYTKLLVISNTACAKANGHDVGEGVLCAADPNGSASCHGDSGGPLVDMDSENLIGIVSFGPTDDCSTIHFGTAFTRVTSNRQWIYNQTGI